MLFTNLAFTAGRNQPASQKLVDIAKQLALSGSAANDTEYFVFIFPVSGDHDLLHIVFKTDHHGKNILWEV